MQHTLHGLARFSEREPPPPPSSDAPEKFREAPLYDADEGLRTAVELALELGQPLLITGEPGCGKTAAAYWATWRLGLMPEALYHIQIRSSATAAELKYDFDNIGYLRESQVAGTRGETWTDAQRETIKQGFVNKGPLWNAFEAARQRSVVLLLDEIDKAPRDFPNDLLHEFDQLEFEVPEWRVQGRPLRISARGAGHTPRADGASVPNANREPFLLVVFTSNGERRLPDAFLRRCVHHHLAFDEQRMLNIVRERAKRRNPSNNGKTELSDSFVEYAVRRFWVLKRQPELNHQPGLAELLIWLRVLANHAPVDEDRLKNLPPAELPYLGLLLKDPDDRKRIEAKIR